MILLYLLFFFSSSGALSVSAIAHSYPPRHNPLLLDNLDCTGTEASLLDCKHNPLSTSTTLCADTQDVTTVQCPLGIHYCTLLILCLMTRKEFCLQLLFWLSVKYFVKLSAISKIFYGFNQEFQLIMLINMSVL